MKIYWSPKSVPELVDLPEKERKMIWRQCYLNAFRNWQTWLALAACGGCTALGMALGDLCGEFVGDFTAAIIGAAIGGGIGGFFFGQVATAMTRPYIREYLKLHDQVCPD